MAHKWLRTNSYTTNKTKKSKRNCIRFPSSMSKQDLSTRSKTCMHLKKFIFFPIFTGQQTQNQRYRYRPQAKHFWSQRNVIFWYTAILTFTYNYHHETKNDVINIRMFLSFTHKYHHKIKDNNIHCKTDAWKITYKCR